MHNYVISLISADQRREHIKQQFDKKEVDFKFFDAVTPALALSLSKDMGLNYNEKYLTEGELACFMSHVSLWKKIVDENISYMAIFEDDIYLGENAREFLNFYNWIKEDWDIVKLELTQSKIIISNKLELSKNDREFFELQYPHLGAGAYILSNACAIKLIQYIIKMDSLLPVDEIIFRNLINVENYKILQMSPALCVQDIIVHRGDEVSNFKSSLIKERGVRMHKEKHSPLQKVIREFKRFINQIKMLLFAKKIDFK